MYASGAFLWLEPLTTLAPLNVVTSVLVMSVLLSTAYFARLSLKRAIASEEGALVPEDRLTLRTFFELIGEKLFALTKLGLGEHDAPKYFSFIGALFLFIFTSNVLGLIPGFLPPTDDLNTTLALGTFVFLYYNFVGFKENGMAYLAHFFGPVAWLAPLMVVIELASHIFRPLSLGLRLQGNIMGDHVVLHIFSELTHLVIPAIFYGIGLFVSFIQAFVFCLMTMVYISLSTSHDH